MVAAARGRSIGAMTTLPATTRIPVGPVLLAGLGAQLVDDALFFVVPPFAVAAPFAGLVAILLTAAAARYVSRDRTGAAIARTGLAVGGTSAAIGLLVGGLGFVPVLLAVLTVVAGVAGAVVGRGVPAGRTE
ncbi:hypothetical protein BJF78_08035 [Pseudonocardia sp. CNS-139]|nr:hypothetical protein BJF78_08035 [Pseudonocardia sp. CNS-139]